jgi:hypothetical protein
MDNMIFLYGIVAVVTLMACSLVGMALVKSNKPAPVSVPLETHQE